MPPMHMAIADTPNSTPAPGDWAEKSERAPARHPIRTNTLNRMPEAEHSGPHTRNHAPGTESPQALPATLLQRAVDLALQVALGHARPLVVQLLAAAQTQQQLHAAVLVEI